MPRSDAELRLLVHAPRGRDAAVIDSVLAAQGLVSHVCKLPSEIVDCIEAGAAGVIVTEEALPELMGDRRLPEMLENQPPWSDLPFIVLASRREGRRARQDFEVLHSLGNLILLERPLNAETLASASESTVRARRRQYATRQHLEELSRTRGEVELLNTELEHRIRTRTRELASANDRLMKEIAERERAQSALTQVQKMEAIGRLTGGIAHDFNNLLHVVNMNLELVSLYAKDEKLKPVVERAKGAAKRGSRLTNQLLSFARSQSLLPKLTHVNALLVGMKDLLEISVGSGIEVEYELCDNHASVVLDPSQLEMAVLNLAVNSRDAMPGGGKLKISTCTRTHRAESDLNDGDYVSITVTDTGDGIPAHVLPKVFDPFFTTKPLGQGTGLGLSQVYGFARQSGGLAHVRSEPGKGTTVEMLFPASSLEPEEIEVVAAPGMPAQAKGAHILVVEDDNDVRRVIVECLSLIGYQVTEAANGSEGVLAVRTQRPDLMVVDFAMPDMTGAEVIAQVHESNPDLPVILATGYADMNAVERLAGKPSILRKPFDIAALGDAVHDALESVKERAPAVSGT